MTTVTLKGNKVSIEGEFLTPSELAPDFVLVNKALENVTLKNFKGHRKVIATVPSVDTSVCSKESHDLNRLAMAHPGVAFLIVSKDLPFRQESFCSGEKLANVTFLSDLRPTSRFAKDYGVAITSGPLAGLLSRSVIVLNEHDKVLYSELVSEITTPPNFDKLLDHLE